ncbi:MAG: hypothetical protein IKM30_05570 [Oscillospiraceae bacterium]|nr:hypothetical protein [Oscillospiraceae bacterium]
MNMQQQDGFATQSAPEPQQDTVQQTQQAAPQAHTNAVRDPDVRFCRNCGKQIQWRAAVCVHCNTVLNPVAYQRARKMVEDRNARVTRAELIRSGVFPIYGFSLARRYQQDRPQVAKPCRTAARIGAVLWCIAIAAVCGVAWYLTSIA